MNILLLEPDKILGGSIKSAIESAGHFVSWKHTAQTALDSLDDTVPDLIILELQLGIHNGIEFLYEVSSYPEWRHIAVIVHTINANAQDEIYGASLSLLNVRSVLYKPRTSTVQLVKLVKQLEPVI